MATGGDALDNGGCADMEADDDDKDLLLSSADSNHPALTGATSNACLFKWDIADFKGVVKLCCIVFFA